MKIETKLKKQGWELETFQPKGEEYPWSLKISKTVSTRGLHSDSVTDWVRQCGGRYVITAFLNPTGKLSEKEKEERIISAVKWELIKQYDNLHKYDYLNKLTEIVGEVHPLVFKKRVQKAYVSNSNEKALEVEREEAKQVKKVKTAESKQIAKAKADKKVSGLSKKEVATTKATVKKAISKSSKVVKKSASSLGKSKASEENKRTKQAKPTKKTTAKSTVNTNASDKKKVTKTTKTTTSKKVAKDTKKVTTVKKKTNSEKR